MSPEKPTFREAFLFWLKLGFISFGGPAGQIAIMHDFLVDRKKWISDSRFMHGLNYCMILPGPEAQQLATYIGWLLHGVRGGLAAGILFILPSIFILLGLSIVYVLFGEIESVSSVFYGLKPAVIAIVLVALFKIGKKSLLTIMHYGIALASFAGIFFFNVPFPLIILTSLVIGFVLHRYLPGSVRETLPAKAHDDEYAYYLNRHSPAGAQDVSVKGVIRKTAIGVLLGLFPLALFYALRPDSGFWLALSGFFTKAALVTFGGAYAVLPYVAQVSVERFGWLSEYEMIDGLALGETTPGPLIMVLVFVGFMAGYRHGNGSLTDGTLGLLTTAFYTFLPCFLFIFIGAPFVERTKDNKNVKAVLAVVTAAVVGVMLNLTLYLGKAVVFPSGIHAPDWFAVLWLLVSFVALYRLRLNMVVWIGISAAAGFAYHLM